MTNNTVRLAGTITAQTPIFITRPDQGAKPLTTTVIRQGAPTRAHVIPGETIKGMLRANAYGVCVDAAEALGPIQASLASFYLQTAGGLGFGKESSELGAAEALRPKQPILSVFGAASPKLTGRISIGPAIAQPIVGGPDGGTMDMPPGTRRDQLLATPDLSRILSPADREKWARQASIISDASLARATLVSAERALARAQGRNRNGDTIDVAALEANVTAARAALTVLEENDDFEHAIQRPLPPKPASPAGLVYDHEIRLTGATDAEVGLLLAALQKWAADPRIGGGRTAGYGRVSAYYTIEVLSGAALPRQCQFSPIGSIAVGQPNGDTDVISANSESGAVIERWLDAWAAIEAHIAQTEIFQ